jgi:two-component system, LytTR family, response regulator
MNRIKTIIIDDIPENVNQIAEITRKDDRYEVVATANNGEEGLKAIAKHNPALVLLDIEMPVMGGFDMVMELKNYHSLNPTIVFITVFDEFAIKAIKHSAFDYILKTNLEKELPATLNKFALQKVSSGILLKQQIELLAGNLESNQQIIISTKTADIFVRPSDIIYIKFIKAVTCKIFLTNGQEEITNNQLINIENSLPNNIFFRLDKKHLINSQHILKVDKEENSRRFIHLKGLNEVTRLQIPIRKRKEFMDFIERNKVFYV